MSDYDKYLDAVKEQIQLNNEWSAKQAQQQMDFQERMSNTSHQREMFDLQAAGLNPVLTANQGASTPSGAMAQNNDGVSAYASILAKVLDTENANARAAMYAAASGRGSVSSGLGYSDINGILSLFGLGLPNSAIRAAEKVKELASGLDNKYFTAENGINYSAIWNDAKQFVNDAINGIKTNVSNGATFKTSSASKSNSYAFDLTNPGKVIPIPEKEGIISKVYNAIKNGISKLLK